MSLTFEWFCRQERENWTKTNLPTNFVTYPKVQHHDTAVMNKSMRFGNFSGCFGTGMGAIFGQGKLCPPSQHFLFKVNNGNTRTICETCSKLIMKTPERR